MSNLDDFADGFILPFASIRRFFRWLDHLGVRIAEWMIGEEDGRQ